MKSFILDALRAQAHRVPADPITGKRMDANETLVFSRNLEYVYSQFFKQLYVPPKARLLMPVDNSVPSGADSHTFTQYDEYGEAKILSTFRANDFPQVEVKGTQTTAGVRHYGDSYGYTLQEMRAAALARVPLDMLRASAARNAMEAKLDALACTGDGVNLKGLANCTTNDASSVTSHGTWASASIANIVDDANDWMASRFTAAKGVEELMPDTLVLPTAPFAALAYNPVALAYGGTQNALDYLLSQVKGLKRIVHWARLDTADGSGGARAILFKQSPEVAALVIPQEIEQFAPEVNGMAFDVRLHASFGGVRSVYPIGISFSDALA